MIPVYICDDEPLIRNYLADKIKDNILIQGYGMEVACVTDSPTEVLDICKESGVRGIYFLDVDLKLPDIDGFALAKEIRRLDPRGFIIFVTTHGELAFETFKYRVEAMDYIVKDDITAMESRISACLTNVEEHLLREKVDDSQIYTIKIFDEIHHIPIRQILYFETSHQKHRLVVHSDKTS